MSNWYSKPEIFGTQSNSWTFNGGGYISNTNTTSSLVWAGAPTKKFLPQKTYKFRVKIRNLKQLGTGGIYIRTQWGEEFTNKEYTQLSTNDGFLTFYSSPKIEINRNNNPDIFFGNFDVPTGPPLIYVNQFVDQIGFVNFQDKEGKFGGATHGIFNIDIKETDWNLFGYSWLESNNYSPTGSQLTGINRSNGWSYVEASGGNPEYYQWAFINGYNSGTESEPDCGVVAAPAGSLVVEGGETSSVSDEYSNINHLSRYIDYNFFNLYFSWGLTQSGAAIDANGFRIVLSKDEPYAGPSLSFFNSWLANSTVIASFTQSGASSSAIFGLKGNQYLSFIGDRPPECGDPASASLYGFIILNISGLKIEGGYASENNRVYSLNQNFEANLSSVTYSSIIGSGNTFDPTNPPIISQVLSRIGNGTFKTGIWENGVWNNGWRLDESVREFDDIDISISIISEVRWRIRIVGSSESVSHFKIGDEVTIGNIIAIDINERRRLIKDKFRIIDLNATGINERIGFIFVEFNTTFPIRRVERDSKKHKIKITKNAWLSGAFLNGYFTGVWNFGLFKGYPLITEMFNTNWIDGIFDGGHFQSQYYINGTFSDVIFRNNKVGLTFSSPHRLAVGDILEIEMDDKSVNSAYNGETRVLSVINDFELVTDVDYLAKKSGLESGKFTTEIATSVIQNMNFNSNNISRKTSIETLNTDEVFVYNSWIDVNYSNQSAVNIGKPQTKINSASRKTYSENNLYGYPTDDVLSSESRFRDSYTLNNKSYKLGNKWRLFNDYVGESSKFTEYFGESAQDTQLFLNQGWTFSKFDGNSITFSRTNDEGAAEINGEELKVQAIGRGGVLDISQPSFNINNRKNREIEKDRYTVIEFDLVTFSVVPKQFVSSSEFLDNQFYNNKYILPNEPFIHFDNINKTKRNIDLTIGTTSTSVQGDVSSEYLPIYKNIEHLETKKRKKVEFFFNKRNLSMNFTGGGFNSVLFGNIGQINTSQSEFIINNLKIYEVDMIPFFQYFIDININKSIQVPFQGIAPYIDYENSDFSFIDSINIGLDSIKVESTLGLFTGVGQGIISSGVSFGGVVSVGVVGGGSGPVSDTDG